MKRLRLIWIIIFVTVGFNTFAQTEKHIAFIPLAIGNYWIYSTTSKSHPFDTLRIVGIKVIDGDSAFLFDNGSLMFERNDSVFDYQSQWESGLFKCFQYFPSDKELYYSIFVGGDVIIGRAVSKIQGQYKLNGIEYSNCYKFLDGYQGVSNNEIICRGIGIIRTEREDGYVRTLVEYKVTE